MYIYTKNNYGFNPCQTIPIPFMFKLWQSQTGELFLYNIENQKLFQLSITQNHLEDNFLLIMLEHSENQKLTISQESPVSYQQLVKKNLNVPVVLEKLNEHQSHNELKQYCWHRTENSIIFGHSSGKISIWKIT